MKKEDERKDFIFIIIIILVLVIGLLSYLNNNKENVGNLFGELSSLGIIGDYGTGVYFPEECGIDSLNLTWSSIFKTEFSNLTIYNSADCNRIFIYKTLENNLTYILIETRQNSPDYLKQNINAYFGNFTISFRYDLNNLANNFTNNQKTEDELLLLIKTSVLGVRNIANSLDANNEFSNIYKITNSSWISVDDLGGYNNFKFIDNGQGIIYKAIQLDHFNQIYEKKLLAYYSFEGNANDNSGNGNHGNVTNAVLTTGILGQGYYFNESSYILLNKIFLNKQAYWSFSAWIYPLNRGVIYSEGIFGTGSAFVLKSSINNSICIDIWNKDYVESWISNCSSINAITLNKWNFITIVMQNAVNGSGNVSYYVDKNLISRGSGQSENNLNLNVSYIGRQINGNLSFNGTIDEIKIWNYAISDSMIITEYERGYPKNCSESDNGDDIFVLGTTQNSSGSSFTDSCINQSLIREYYCITDTISIGNRVGNCSAYKFYCSNGACVNHVPRFLSYDCDDLVLIMNQDYMLNIANCFTDPLGGLSYRYELLNNSNISIIRNNTNWTIIPRENWVGTSVFYVYANDSYNETKGVVEFDVVRRAYQNTTRTNTTNITSSTTNTQNTTTITTSLKIKSPSPVKSAVSLDTSQNKTFSIGNNDYDSVKWYLDGEVIQEGGNSYNIAQLKEGQYELEVKITKGTLSDSKKWNISIVEKPNKNLGSYVFYVIVIVIIIVIILVIVLILMEINKKRHVGGFGFDSD